MTSAPGDIDARLAKLLTEFPERVCRYEPLFELRWEAHRRPCRYPAGGCFGRVSAASGERLREMLTAAARIEGAGCGR